MNDDLSIKEAEELEKLQSENEILTKENKELKKKIQGYEEDRTQFKFSKFRQKMCDLLWECGCDNISLNDETNAKQIFDNAHYICNKLLEEYNISEK